MSGTTFSAGLDVEDGEFQVCTPPAALLSSTPRTILVLAVSADALVCFFNLLARVNSVDSRGEVSIGHHPPACALASTTPAMSSCVQALTNEPRDTHLKHQLKRPVAERGSKLTREPGIQGINSESPIYCELSK